MPARIGAAMAFVDRTTTWQECVGLGDYRDRESLLSHGNGVRLHFRVEMESDPISITISITT